MSATPIIQTVADEANVTIDSAMRVLESFLAWIHKLEYESAGCSDTVHQVSFELSDRAFFHFIGLIEEFSKNHEWEPGTIVEYLGRMPPTDRWSTLSLEMEHWQKRNSHSDCH